MASIDVGREFVIVALNDAERRPSHDRAGDKNTPAADPASRAETRGGRPSRWHGGAWLVFALLVAIATPSVERFLPRHVRVPETSIELAGPWELIGTPAEVRTDRDAVRLVNRDPDAVVMLRMVREVMPSSTGLFRVQARIAAEDVVAHRPDFPFAEMTLSTAGDGRIDEESLAANRIAGLRGTMPAQRYTRELQLGKGTDRIVLTIRLPYVTGAVTVQQLRLIGYRTRIVYDAASTAVMAGWVVVLLTGAFLFWRGTTDRRLARALLLLVPVGIFLIVMPEELRGAGTDWIADMIGVSEISPEVVAKTGHFILFVAVGLLTRLSRPRDPSWLQLLGLVLAGGAGELLQFMTASRHPALFDWMVNTGGGTLGWCLASLWLARYGVPLQPATQISSDRTSPPQAAKQLR